MNRKGTLNLEKGKSMSSFKLIGIRPFENCPSKIKKNLNHEKIFSFYNSFRFEYNKDFEVVNIYNVKDLPEDFYSLERDDFKPTISISAVVGKNGSGKSTLIDLLVMCYYRISLDVDEFSKGERLLDFKFEDKLPYENEKRKLIASSIGEIYYTLESKIYRIQIKASSIEYQIYSNHERIWIEAEKVFSVTNFYNLIINYSLYAFNEYHDSIALRTLFHKNDGYQMPLVIHPYREFGKIDVNQENYLSRARLLSNLVHMQDLELFENHVVTEIELAIDDSKSDKTYFFKSAGGAKFGDLNIQDIEAFLLIPLFEKFECVLDSHEMTEVQVKAIEYLVYKIYTTVTRYNQFQEFIEEISSLYIGEKFLKKKNRLNELVHKIFEDRSHTTLKIRQLINFIHNDLFGLNIEKGIITLPIEDFKSSLRLAVKKSFFSEDVEFLPPSFISTRIKFSNKSNFDRLSSGQKQLLFSTQSILYHLNNIESVHKSVGQQNNLYKYKNVNIVLDEIEMFFHPELQRKTIYYLIKSLRQQKFSNLESINILLLTHSPFILSDIPKQNILCLKKGSPDLKQKIVGFAGNIHEMLSYDFFLTDGLIGDFAKAKIQETIDWLKTFIEEKNIDPEIPLEIINKHKNLINQVDEPLLEFKLNEMFDTVFPKRIDKDIVTKQIIDLAKKSGIDLNDLTE